MKLTEQIEKALEAATPGPWRLVEESDPSAQEIVFSSKQYGVDDLIAISFSNRNTNLIANAPTWLSQLLQERAVLVEALKHYTTTNVVTGEGNKAKKALEQVGELDD